MSAPARQAPAHDGMPGHTLTLSGDRSGHRVVVHVVCNVQQLWEVGWISIDGRELHDLGLQTQFRDAVIAAGFGLRFAEELAAGDGR